MKVGNTKQFKASVSFKTQIYEATRSPIKNSYNGDCLEMAEEKLGGDCRLSSWGRKGLGSGLGFIWRSELL